MERKSRNLQSRYQERGTDRGGGKCGEQPHSFRSSLIIDEKMIAGK